MFDKDAKLIRYGQRFSRDLAENIDIPQPQKFYFYAVVNTVVRLSPHLPYYLLPQRLVLLTFRNLLEAVFVHVAGPPTGTLLEKHLPSQCGGKKENHLLVSVPL